MAEISGFFQGTGMPDPDWWEALWPDPAGVLVKVGITSGMEVIDLCCGDGWFTLPLARLASHTVAIDIDGNLLKEARIRLVRNGIEHCDLIEGNAYNIAEMVEHPVDFVFLANSFHGVSDKTRLSRAVRSVLKPQGCFAIINWHARPREETQVLGKPRGPATELRMTPEATIAEVERSGLKLRHTVEVSPYHYAVVFDSSGN